MGGKKRNKKNTNKQTKQQPQKTSSCLPIVTESVKPSDKHTASRISN